MITQILRDDYRDFSLVPVYIRSNDIPLTLSLSPAGRGEGEGGRLSNGVYT